MAKIGIKKKIASSFAAMLSAGKKANYKVLSSMFIMGLGQIFYKQFVKGILLLLVQALFITYLVLFGGTAIYGFFTLGTFEGNAWYGVVGDDSVTMLLMGILAFILIFFYLFCYIANVKDVYKTQLRVEEGGGKAPLGFYEEIKQLLDSKFYITVLALPILGVCIFNVLPVVFMLLIAFTNYGGSVVPPQLVDWTGFESFTKILTLSQFAPTFFKILVWNLLWAVLSTAINYFGGLGLALLLNKKCVRGKAIWRAFPILAYAMPGFITLLGFKFMFSYGGPINQMIKAGGGAVIGFLDLDAKWMARAIGLGVNAWISIPTAMLLATGILSNLNKDLFEAAKIDGASAFKQFLKITLPFVLFATMPVLITQFTANFNNFGVFYFLRSGISDGYFLANDTDLLINWLYKLSIDNNYYAIGAAISLIIFIITSTISLLVYVLSPSYKQEDTFR